MDNVSVADASGTGKDITSHKLDEKLNVNTKLVCNLCGGKVGLVVNNYSLILHPTNTIELYINIIQYW